VEEELELVRAACTPVDREAFLAGNLTPVFFGSALRNFGVADLLDGLVALAPPPRDQQADRRVVKAEEPRMTGFVFKIQANMDPAHRDRIAFVRLCSGRLERGMRVKLPRSGKSMSLNSPQFFFGQDRGLAEEAFAGDVVGLPNHGALRIGDTLTEGEELRFLGVPAFAPEILRRVIILDAMKAKKLRQALTELAEEGVMQIFRPLDGALPLVGVIGQLQLDVLTDRLANEYGVEVKLEAPPFQLARWIACDDPVKLKAFIERHRGEIAQDLDDDPVLLATSIYALEYTARQHPEIRFSDVKDVEVVPSPARERGGG
jgi:peptide chain release factor 3